MNDTESDATGAQATIQTQLQPQLDKVTAKMDALHKTQHDLIVYLQDELDRRRTWEETLNRELHQRHSVLVTLITRLMPVDKPSTPAATSTTTSATAPHTLSTLAKTSALPSVPRVPSVPARTTPRAATSTDAHVVNVNEVPAEPDSDSARRGSKRKADDEADDEVNIDMDENGVIYMAGGIRKGIIPAKIQVSVTRSNGYLPSAYRANVLFSSLWSERPCTQLKVFPVVDYSFLALNLEPCLTMDQANGNLATCVGIGVSLVSTFHPERISYLSDHFAPSTDTRLNHP